MRVAVQWSGLNVAALVLAAGASTRLGQPKQNVRLGGETLLERALRTAQSAALSPIWVVVAQGSLIVPDRGAVTVVNEEAAEGMASSIRAGIRVATLAGVDGVVILACDQPAVTEEHLRILGRSANEIVASAYAGHRGIPAYFPRSAFEYLLELSGDCGAREMLRSARTVPLSKGELDIDTADDLKRARELYAGDPSL